MFYSHEVLTSRKYGVATIWLVATLGQKSSVRKVSRRKMQEVDVPKACEVIITPTAPMALRLSANLLFGVSKVYDQQCAYVLDEARHIHSNMRAAFKPLRIDEVVDGMNRAKPEYLALPDDPTFFPAIDFDALKLDIVDPHYHETQESLLSTLLARSQSSVAGVALEFPSQSSISPAHHTSLGGSVSGRGTELLERLPHLDDDAGLLPDLDISIDFDGNILDNTTGQLVPGSTPIDRRALPSLPQRVSGVVGATSVAVDAVLDSTIGVKDNQPLIYDLSNAESAFQDHSMQVLSSDTTTQDQLQTTAQHRRRPRAPRPLPTDVVLELRTRDLLDLQANYIHNMETATQTAHNRRDAAIAKRNAQFWVYGHGLNRIGLAPNVAAVPSALDFFTGAKLLEWATGLDPARFTRTVHKRSSEEIEDSQLEEDEQRHQRRRIDDAETTQLGRAAADDEGMLDFADDTELARAVADVLDDVSTAMPWNTTASIRGSSVARGATASATQSVIRPSPITAAGRRRLISESPLTGRGPRSSILAGASIQETMPPSSHLGSASEAEGFGAEPPSEVDSIDAATQDNAQTVTQAQLQNTMSEQETENFLGFIEKGLQVKRDQLETSASTDLLTIQSIDFEELMPPTRTKLLTVSQIEPFASIEIAFATAVVT